MRTHIGFAGPKGIGKSTIANKFVEKLNKEPSIVAKVFSFASTVKEIAKLLVEDDIKKDAQYLIKLNKYRIKSNDSWAENILKGSFTTGRNILVAIGEGFRDIFSKDVWARILVGKIIKYFNSFNYNKDLFAVAVIDDVRHLEEAEVISYLIVLLPYTIKFTWQILPVGILNRWGFSERPERFLFHLLKRSSMAVIVYEVDGNRYYYPVQNINLLPRKTDNFINSLTYFNEDYAKEVAPGISTVKYYIEKNAINKNGIYDLEGLTSFLVKVFT